MDAFVDDLRDNAAGSALLFDIDGVLAPIVANAGDARVPDDILGLLRVLSQQYLLVGAISGRALTDVDSMVPVPAIGRGGNHGLEVAPPGEASRMVPEAEGPVAVLRAFVDRLEPQVLAAHGAWMEDKGASVSLHYRESPDPAGTGDWLRAEVALAALAAGLRTRDGKMILELLPDVDVDKGTALQALVGAAGARRVLYVGDDHTDADAWRAMRNMAQAGLIDAAYCVLADGPEVDAAVKAAADESVAGTDGVRRLMEQLAG